MKIVSLVTARGGSKGFPGKNIANFAGKPLIAWTIEASLDCSEVGRTIVSTDSPEIAEVSMKFGAEVPFIRPYEIAQDSTPALPVILHALGWLAENDKTEYDAFFLLQPTSPLRNSQDLKDSISIMKNGNADSVVSVCSAREHPLLMKKIAEDGSLESLFGDSENVIRQKFPPIYILNGAIYLSKINFFLRMQSFYAGRCLPLLMPDSRSADIDSKHDLDCAELLMRNLDSNGGKVI